MSSRRVDSLRLQLLGWVLLPLAAILSINAWLSNRASVESVAAAFDRLLVASADAIAENIETRDGEIVVDLPYAALQVLESNLQERIFYRVIAPDGRTVTGYDDLPAPRPARGAVRDRTLYAAMYRGERVYLASRIKPLYDAGRTGAVTVVVAETGEARDALSSRILWDGLQRQAVLIVAAAALAWFGLDRALRRLERLREELARRGDADTGALDASSVQTEIRPLIHALNQHTGRIERLIASRQRLIADASHQMRTPLAEMHTQIDFTLRQDEPTLWRLTLIDLRADIARLARMLSQLLVLARVDPDGLRAHAFPRIDLVDVVRQATRDHVPAARTRRVDLALDGADAPVPVAGNAVLLRELVSNLIDNALVHGRDGGRVIVSVGLRDGHVELAVEDAGPGIPSEARARAFERFQRVTSREGRDAPGSGLGLSIVRDIARAHRGEAELHDGVALPGLRVVVTLPTAA